MAASSFTFFASYYEALRYLPDDGCGKMLKAMCEYAFSDTEPQFSDPTQQGYWTLIKPILNRSLERSKAGRQGGNNGLGVSRNIGNSNASKSIANSEQIKSKTKQERNGIGVGKGKGKGKEWRWSYLHATRLCHSLYSSNCRRCSGILQGTRQWYRCPTLCRFLCCARLALW